MSPIEGRNRPFPSLRLGSCQPGRGSTTLFGVAPVEREKWCVILPVEPFEHVWLGNEPPASSSDAKKRRVCI
jgi:hypothetical protein